jgi:hypothetical protein
MNLLKTLATARLEDNHKCAFSSEAELFHHQHCTLLTGLDHIPDCDTSASWSGFWWHVHGIHKRMLQFQKLTRNLFLTLHGQNVHHQQRQLPKFRMRYQQFASHTYFGAAGPVSKMASQQEKAFCVLRFEASRSVITVQREVCARFRTAGSARETWTVATADGVRFTRVGWETYLVNVWNSTILLWIPCIHVSAHSAISAQMYRSVCVQLALLIIQRAECSDTITQTSVGAEAPSSCQLSLAPPAAPTDFHSLPAAPWTPRYPCGSLSSSCSLQSTIQHISHVIYCNIWYHT